jgi:PAS domain-containing protein
MTSARFKSTLLILLFIPALFLMAKNLPALAYALLHPELRTGLSFSGALPLALAALLGAALFLLLARSLARGRRQAAVPPPTDRSLAQAEWQQTFNALPDFVSVHDRDFKIVRANSALCEFLDKKPEEIIGRYCYQLFHGRDNPIAGCPHAKAQDVGHAVTMEVDDAHLGVPLLITCAPFVDGKGEFVGSVHMARIQAARSARHTVAPHLLIPICASCKDIRDERGNWIKIEDYVRLRFHGLLTHSICGECQKKIYPQLFQD